jgi:hypothetical protein
MSDSAPQSFASHRRYVPLYHFVASLLLLINLGWAGVRIYHARSGGRFDVINGVVELLLAVALIIIWAYLRIFPLGVQDRIIRLEMRLRLAELLSADLRTRIGELSAKQLIALRFASDAELPALTRKVLDERIDNQDAIKRLIQSWQPDSQRI